MPTILLLYASHYGQTKKIAEHIAGELRSAGHGVELVAAVEHAVLPSPAAFDAVVIGSRIEIGKHAPTVRDYVRKHLGTLQRMPTAFFSVSMSATETAKLGADPNGYVKKFLDDLQWTPTLQTAIGGALPYRSYNWFLRGVMKLISKRAGHPTDTTQNYTFTDWARVDAFAGEIAKLA